MEATDQTIYRLLLWAVPVLLSIIGFIGALMVSQLMKLSKSVNDIKVIIASLDSKHDDLKERVNKLENKVFN